MESKIQELTDKLFREGVEKGNEEAQRIVEKANGEAAGIVKNAQKEAEEIVAAAEKKAAELLNNTKKELGLYAGQTVAGYFFFFERLWGQCFFCIVPFFLERAMT